MVDNYAMYKGKEYRVAQKESNRFHVISDIPQEGFTEYTRSIYTVYIKSVNLDELEEIYEKRTLCKYEGHEFEVDKINEDMVLIWTSYPSLAQKLNFERIDKYGWEKWVDKNEVNIYEKKISKFKKDKQERKEYKQKDDLIDF